MIGTVGLIQSLLSGLVYYQAQETNKWAASAISERQSNRFPWKEAYETSPGPYSWIWQWKLRIPLDVLDWVIGLAWEYWWLWILFASTFGRGNFGLRDALMKIDEVSSDTSSIQVIRPQDPWHVILATTKNALHFSLTWGLQCMGTMAPCKE